MDHIDRIYYTLLGEIREEYAVPGVENLYAPGSPCCLEYEKMLASYARLCGRLDAEEDLDAEDMLNALCFLRRAEARAMYRLGLEEGNRGRKGK